MKTLSVWLGGREAGTLTRTNHGGLDFTYDDAYRAHPDATPLSLSMPLAGRRYVTKTVSPFLWGLLPNNSDVLERWGRDFGVSPTNEFALLEHVGQDCAGAVQFLPPGTTPAPGRIDWLTDADVGDRLADLRADPTAWLGETDQGHFSLAGSQAKFALLRDPTRGWGQPNGATPTTHILKPAGRMHHQDLNEFLCLRTASRLGLATSEATVETFAGEPALIVTRYDRSFRPHQQSPTRIHQEDFCQALAVMPKKKYRSQDGPDLPRMLKLLHASAPREHATRDARRLVEAQALNWALGGTDGHAKNYALLLNGPKVRLAPLYDITSVLPYAQAPLCGGRRTTYEMHRLALALKVGSHVRLQQITAADWRQLAVTAGPPPEEDVIETLVAPLLKAVPDALAQAAADAAAVPDLPPDHQEFLSGMVDAVTNHVRTCMDALTT